jgi:hypothetical protein
MFKLTLQMGKLKINVTLPVILITTILAILL